MTVYRQSWQRTDWLSSGPTLFRLSVASDYTDLFRSAPDVTERMVDFITVGTVKEDIEDVEGKFAEEEMVLEISAAAVSTEDEHDCFGFMLEAQDVTLERYVLLEVQEPAMTAYAVKFRGVLRPDMQGDDLRWYGPQYGTSPAPMRTWKLSAKVYNVHVLDRGLDDLMDYATSSMTPALDVWRVANVLNYRAYNENMALDDGNNPNPYLWAAAYWGALVEINAFLRYLADCVQAMSAVPGFAIEFAPAAMPFVCGTPEIVPYRTYFTVSNERVAEPIQIMRLETRMQTAAVMMFGDGQDGFRFSWWMVEPRDDSERSFSILRAETFAGLLFAIARSFGMWPEYTYTTSGNLTVTFKNRETIYKNPDGSPKVVYFRDADAASIKVEPHDATASGDRHNGYANTYAVEGYDTYRTTVDGFERSERMKATSVQNPLMFTIGPTTYDGLMGQRYMHNAANVFHTTLAPPPGPTTNDSLLGALHTAIYVPTTERRYAATSGGGVVPLDPPSEYTSVRPVSQIDVVIDGEHVSFTELSEYVSRLTKRDGLYYKGEYQLTIPGLQCFRTTPTGPESMFNLTPGASLSLDGTTWLVLGIERDVDMMETRLRLHYLSRFSLVTRPEAVQAIVVPDEDHVIPVAYVGSSTSHEYVAAEDIMAGDIVSSYDDGRVYRSVATTEHYLRVLGVAVRDALQDERVPVVTQGLVTVPYHLDVTRQVFVGTNTYANRTQDRLTAAATWPDVMGLLDQPVGIPVGPFLLNVQIGRPFLWKRLESCGAQEAA